MVAQLLMAGLIINVAGYVFSTEANAISQTREIVAVLPFSAALAGRLLGGRLQASKLVPVLLVVLLGYLAGFAREISQPAVPAQNAQLTSWLLEHHLHTGLSGYWQSNIVTLTSGNRVQIRLMAQSGKKLIPASFESKTDWYDPKQSTANFVVLSPPVAGYPGYSAEGAVLATFGKPARTYHVGPYTILVWNRNLLSDFG